MTRRSRWRRGHARFFERYGDSLRVARLDSNVGNILHRLDRFTEALEYYQRAYQVFQERNEAGDGAVALHNMAICYISLNRFGDALETYRRARGHWQQQKKPLLVAEADYNIAYLYYIARRVHACDRVVRADACAVREPRRSLSQRAV